MGRAKLFQLHLSVSGFSSQPELRLFLKRVSRALSAHVGQNPPPPKSSVWTPDTFPFWVRRLRTITVTSRPPPSEVIWPLRAAAFLKMISEKLLNLDLLPRSGSGFEAALVPVVVDVEPVRFAPEFSASCFR